MLNDVLAATLGMDHGVFALQECFKGYRLIKGRVTLASDADKGVVEQVLDDQVWRVETREIAQCDIGGSGQMSTEVFFCRH